MRNQCITCGHYKFTKYNRKCTKKRCILALERSKLVRKECDACYNVFYRSKNKENDAKRAGRKRAYCSKDCSTGAYRARMRLRYEQREERALWMASCAQERSRRRREKKLGCCRHCHHAMWEDGTHLCLECNKLQRKIQRKNPEKKLPRMLTHLDQDKRDKKRLRLKEKTI